MKPSLIRQSFFFRTRLHHHQAHYSLWAIQLPKRMKHP
jgi:uncharacterized membrane protein YcfT